MRLPGSSPDRGGELIAGHLSINVSPGQPLPPQFLPRRLYSVGARHNSPRHLVTVDFTTRKGIKEFSIIWMSALTFDLAIDAGLAQRIETALDDRKPHKGCSRPRKGAGQGAA